MELILFSPIFLLSLPLTIYTINVAGMEKNNLADERFGQFLLLATSYCALIIFYSSLGLCIFIGGLSLENIYLFSILLTFITFILNFLLSRWQCRN